MRTYGVGTCRICQDPFTRRNGRSSLCDSCRPVRRDGKTAYIPRQIICAWCGAQHLAKGKRTSTTCSLSCGKKLIDWQRWTAQGRLPEHGPPRLAPLIALGPSRQIRAERRISLTIGIDTFVAGRCIHCDQPFVVLSTTGQARYCSEGCLRRHHRDLRKGRWHDKVSRIFHRDGWICQICLEPVALTTFPDPRSPSVDHVLPVSMGGGHGEDNLRCTHLMCNITRGNRLP